MRVSARLLILVFISRPFTVSVVFSWGVGAVRFCGAYSIVLWSVWVCGVHSVCGISEAFRLVVFVAFMGHWGGPLLTFTALIVFMGHWGWTFVVFTVFVLFMECFGLDVCGIHSVCSVFETFRLVFLFYLFSYSLVVWGGV